MAALAVFFAVANTSASAVAQPAIAEAFAAGPGDVGWVVFGYTISFAVSTALYGRLSERFGVGRTLSFGILLLAGGSLLAVPAPSLEVLIGARVVQGSGAGAIPTLTVAIVAKRFPADRRAFALGLITATVGIAQALGPMLGGVLVDLISWRAAVATGALVAPVAAFVWYDQPQPGDLGRRPDIVGAGLVSIVVGALVFAVNRLPIDGATAATGLAVVLAVSAAWITGRRTARRVTPFIPRSVVLDRGFIAVALAGFLGSAAYLGTIVGLPSALARVHTIDAVGIGFVLAPTAASVAFGSTFNGVAQQRLGRTRTTLLAQLLLFTGALAFAVLGIDRGIVTVALIGIPLGLGFGLLAPPLVGEVASRFWGPSQPTAIGLFYLAFFFGGAVGGAATTAFIQRDISIPGLESGMAGAEALLALFALVGLVATTRARGDDAVSTSRR